jgi:UDP-N-acetylmuramoylalanine--D-glutamate ligase
MKIAILGFGVEGKSLVNYFSKKDVKIEVRDQDKVSVPKGVDLKFGASYLGDLEKFNLVFRSPGIPILHPGLAAARKEGVKITSATKYFVEKCPGKIVGITGTKGKGTVATALFEMLKEDGQEVWLGGNIGTPALDFLDKVKKGDIVVLELSSFQLEDFNEALDIAVVLPVSEDHLDYHPSVKEYVAAKVNIARGAKHSFVCEGSYAKEFSKVAGGEVKKLKLPARLPGYLSKLNVVGKHNVFNIFVAAKVAEALGVKKNNIEKAARAFKGMPHRLELVAEINGAKFYNDSASTNAQTCIAALRSFERPTILLAGGASKNIDYTALGAEIIHRKNLAVVVLMGEVRDEIEDAIDKAQKKLKRKEPLSVITAESYEEAFMVAKLLSQENSVVLFSPGAASFDMFKDYVHRGEMFTRFINEMA